MKESRIPGTYKSTATTENFRRPYHSTGEVENDNYRPVSSKDKALVDTRTLDENYNYRTPRYPGRIVDDAELKKAKAMHKMHGPLPE